jgi:hypothetical protein
MSRTDELMELKKDELVAEADELGLDSSGNKADIAERIARFETGLPPEPVENEDPEPELAPKPETVSLEPEEEAAAVNDGELTLVRFTGGNLSFQVGRHTFTRKHPFKAVPSADAENIYRSFPKKFRPAYQSEVQEYYA